MPPTRKDQLDKAAWSWADDTDPKFITKENILTAYRVNFSRCQSGNCRRNCRGNPHCLSGLGEASLSDDNHESSSLVQDPECEKKAEGLFVGLKNLGATCYVNSLLQLWFHNPVFRNAVFDWDPLDDPDEINNTSLTKGDDYVPQSVVGHLQMLFSLLKYSKCRYIDPTQFVEALGLDTATQQDAQEFSKLFISLLENRLSYQTLPHVRDFIINNFRGKYSYVTRCCKCQTESVSPSLFYELELHLKGHHTLAECLAEFLKEEKLDGANCYHCAICNEKQEALRFINLEALPPVLNLQLLRFVYDRQKGYKKKLTSNVQFPMTIDMGEYLVPKPQQPCLYNLSAVLIHKGVSANSGHYVAHIQNSLTGEWYMFNDENVQKKEGKKLELCEDDEEKIQKGKKRLPKGFLKSNNAYMLVYTAENYKPSDGNEKPLNSRLEKYVERQNKSFDDWYDHIALSKKVGIEKKGEKLAMHSSLSVSENCDLEDIDVISVEWLSYWLQNTEPTVKPINNSKLLCSHSCLNPDQIINCKYVSADMAVELYDRYGGGPRLQGKRSFCHRCVSAKCLVLRTKAKTLEESKEILNLLKQKMEPTDSGYFVDKHALKSWRKRVLDALDENPKAGIKEELTENDEDASAEKSVSNDQIQNMNYLVNKGDQSSLRNISVNFKRKLVNSVKNQNQNVSVPVNVITGCYIALNNLHSSLNKLKLGHTNILEVLSKYKLLQFKLFKLVVRTKSCRKVKRHIVQVEDQTSMSEVKQDQDTEDPSSKTNKPLDKRREGESETDDSSDEDGGFNETLACRHGNLSIDESARKLVPTRVWEILSHYFPAAPSFRSNVIPCQECQNLASEDQLAREQYQEQASAQKNQLKDLLVSRNRPQMGVENLIYLLPHEQFYEPWRKFVSPQISDICGYQLKYLLGMSTNPTVCHKRSDGRKTVPPTSMQIDELLCPHKCLKYSMQFDGDRAKVVPVTKEEWDVLKKFYPTKDQVTINEHLITKPALCDTCFVIRLEDEQKALLDYDRAKVFVRYTSPPTQLQSAEDGDSSDNGSSSKRPKLNGSSATAVSKASATNAVSKKKGKSKRPCVNGKDSGTYPVVMGNPNDIRRSSRRRRAPGEKEVTFFVSSSNTLRDLKFKIMNQWAVAPYDQHLNTQEGRELVDDQSTLAALGIYPNTLLLLRVDEPTTDATLLDDIIQSVEPEAGFKGTELLRNL